MNKKTIEITIEEYSRLKDCETRLAIIKEHMLRDDYCPIHMQVVLGIVKERKQEKELQIMDFMRSKKVIE